ncbi:hypothetical protein COO60DRAFT_932265 [Scenedesmus sp. NREL 46B-D3]|nr:hypothetical protein COO60DRAFT_932265 [Scenedesmus sp. NREL 46B-D3]
MRLYLIVCIVCRRLGVCASWQYWFRALQRHILWCFNALPAPTFAWGAQSPFQAQSPLLWSMQLCACVIMTACVRLFATAVLCHASSLTLAVRHTPGWLSGGSDCLGSRPLPRCVAICMSQLLLAGSSLPAVVIHLLSTVTDLSDNQAIHFGGGVVVPVCVAAARNHMHAPLGVWEHGAQPQSGVRVVGGLHSHQHCLPVAVPCEVLLLCPPVRWQSVGAAAGCTAVRVHMGLALFVFILLLLQAESVGLRRRVAGSR